MSSHASSYAISSPHRLVAQTSFDDASKRKDLSGSIKVSGARDCKILRQMHEDSALSNFFDVVFVVEGCNCPAHKAVMASVSRVFKSMLTNGMKESKHNKHAPSTIMLHDVSVVAFRKMLAFIYSGEIKSLSRADALVLLIVADMYEVNDLLECLQTFLVTLFTIDRCLHLANKAPVTGLSSKAPQLSKTFEDFIASCFEQALKNCGRVKNASEALQSLAKSKVSDRMPMKARALVSWIIADGVNRMDGTSSLILVSPTLAIHRKDECTKIELELLKPSSRGIFRNPLLEKLKSDSSLPRDMTRGFPAALRLRESHLRLVSVEKASHEMAHVFGITDDMHAVSRNPTRVINGAWHHPVGASFRVRVFCYPNGNDCPGYLSAYLEVALTDENHSEIRGVTLDFNLFLIDRDGRGTKWSFSSTRFRKDKSDWGWQRFVSLETLFKPENGFYNEENDSITLGATLTWENRSMQLSE